MSRFVIPIIFIALITVSASSGAGAQTGTNHAETIEIQEEDNSIDTFPLYYFGMPKPLCYRCSEPCQKHTCCSGRFPVCCVVDRKCKCCH